MTDYEMICQESKNLSTEEQARVLQYIQSIQNEKGGGKRETEKPEHCPRCGGNSVIRFGHKRGKQLTVEWRLNISTVIISCFPLSIGRKNPCLILLTLFCVMLAFAFFPVGMSVIRIW